MKKTEKIYLTKKEIGELLKSKNLLPFNRKIKKNHAENLKNSISKYGILRNPIICMLNYDNDKIAIADGQHTLTAIHQIITSKDKIECNLVKCHTKREVIDLIAKLNTTSVGWKLEDFLSAWLNFGIDNPEYRNYKFINDRIEESTLSLDKVLSIFIKDKDMFKGGKVVFNDDLISNTTYIFTKHLRLKYNFPAHTLTGVIGFAKGVKFKNEDEVKYFISRFDVYMDYLKSKRQTITYHRDNIKQKLFELHSLTDFEFSKLISND